MRLRRLLRGAIARDGHRLGHHRSGVRVRASPPFGGGHARHGEPVVRLATSWGTRTRPGRYGAVPRSCDGVRLVHHVNLGGPEAARRHPGA